MNPSEHDGNDEFADRLAEFDAAIAEGRTPAGGTVDDLELAKAEACLERLEALWPRRSRSLDATLNSFGTKIDDRPKQLGRFTIVRELGRGGGGVVFLAHDPQLKRQVALKIPRPEALFTPSLQRRFLREAEAAAQLDHRHIVPIYEAGESGGICYLVSAYCPGPNLAAWLRDRTEPVPVRQAALIVAALAAGVAHVHGRGVLHRDIKPSNVLLASGDASGELPFVPKLTDFGLAKLDAIGSEARLDGTEAVTRTGAILGTPAYMAPEQAEGRLDQVGPATDVYALGTVLYELLAGKPAFGGATDVATLQQVVCDEPCPLSRVRRGVPRDLETICLKCLEKAPARRYADAAALAEDLQRFLDGRPITARRTGGLERTGKRIRRHRAVVGMAVAMIAVVAAILPFALRGPASVINPEDDDPGSPARAASVDELQSFASRTAAYNRSIRRAWKLHEDKELGQFTECLRGSIPQPGERDLRGFEWHYLWRLAQHDRFVLRGHKAPVHFVAFSADGRFCATASEGDGRIILWEWPNGTKIDEYQLGLSGLFRLTFSSNGSRLVSAIRQLHPTARTEVYIVVIKVWELVAKSDTQREFDWLASVNVSLDGRKVVGIYDPYPPSSRSELQIADIESGARRILDKFPGKINRHNPTISPDGKYVAYGRKTVGLCEVHLVDSNEGHLKKKLGTEHEIKNYICYPAFSADGSLIAIGSNLGHGIIWNWAADNTVPFREQGMINELAMNPSGSVVATKVTSPGSPNRIRLRSSPDGTLLRDITPTTFNVENFAITPDGQSIALCGNDHLLHVQPLKPTPATEPLSPPKPSGEAWAVAFSPKSHLLAVGYDHEHGGNAESLKLWDWKRTKAQVLADQPSMVLALTYSPDGTTLATAGYDGRVGLWSADGKHIKWLEGHDKPVRAVAFSPDGKLLASAGSDQTIRIWNLATREPYLVWPAHDRAIRTLAFSPDGRQLASAGNDECAKIWDVETQERLQTLPDDHNISCLAYSPNGAVLATGNENFAVKLWDPMSGNLKQTLPGHTGKLRALAFSPDGRTLATGGEDKMVRLWNVATWEELLALPTEHFINSLAFDKAGRTLAAALHDGTVKIWNAEPPDAKQ